MPIDLRVDFRMPNGAYLTILGRAKLDVCLYSVQQYVSIERLILPGSSYSRINKIEKS